jgi:hypothetical protein
LGICAGAYFGAGAIEFEKGGAYEVCANRSLAFFPGYAEGPAYGKNKYRSTDFKVWKPPESPGKTILSMSITTEVASSSEHMNFQGSPFELLS